MLNRLLLTAVLIVASACMAQAREARGALWRVVQLCAANYRLTGLSFPCLKVALPGDADRGYVVLRPPYGAADTILSPVRQTPGVEDPWLQSPEAPNYFALAWKSLPLLAGKPGHQPEPGEMGLAVNSAHTRSQDQMHIHLDCLAGGVRRTLAGLEAKITETGWMRLPVALHGLSYLARRVAARDLERTNVFALAATSFPGAREDMGHLTIVVTTSASTRAPGYLVLAAKVGNFHRGARPTGEDLLDHACGG